MNRETPRYYRCRTNNIFKCILWFIFAIWLSICIRRKRTTAAAAAGSIDTLALCQIIRNMQIYLHLSNELYRVSIDRLPIHHGLIRDPPYGWVWGDVSPYTLTLPLLIHVCSICSISGQKLVFRESSRHFVVVAVVVAVAAAGWRCCCFLHFLFALLWVSVCASFFFYRFYSFFGAAVTAPVTPVIASILVYGLLFVWIQTFKIRPAKEAHSQTHTVHILLSFRVKADYFFLCFLVLSYIDEDWRRRKNYMCNDKNSLSICWSESDIWLFES